MSCRLGWSNLPLLGDFREWYIFMNSIPKNPQILPRKKSQEPLKLNFLEKICKYLSFTLENTRQKENLKLKILIYAPKMGKMVFDLDKGK